MFTVRKPNGIIPALRRSIQSGPVQTIPAGKESIVITSISSTKEGVTDKLYQEECLNKVAQLITPHIWEDFILFSCIQSVVDQAEWQAKQTALFTGHAMMFYGKSILGQIALIPELTISFTKGGLQDPDTALGRLFPGKKDEIQRKSFGSQSYLIAVPVSATLLSEAILRERKQQVEANTASFNLSNNACIHAVYQVVTGDTIEGMSTQRGIIQTISSIIDIGEEGKIVKNLFQSEIEKLDLGKSGYELAKQYFDMQAAEEKIEENGNRPRL